jgi:hypothetical protein
MMPTSDEASGCPPGHARELEQTRIVAVDWSGRFTRAHRAIWLAEVVHGELVRLERDRSREEVTSELILMLRNSSNLVVGLDFAFGFPAWFVQDRGASSSKEMWEQVAEHGESWLRQCVHPFWGRPGRKRPTLDQHWRLTEQQLAAGNGNQPKSVFQVGGAGAVGTGSIRGMPHLATLRRAGFAIWPFDPAKLPLVVEIYPRTLTGPVVKSSALARSEYLAKHFPLMSDDTREAVAESEDSFDAAVSAFAMWEGRHELLRLEVPGDPLIRLEGQIWSPSRVEPSRRPAASI